MRLRGVPGSAVAITIERPTPAREEPLGTAWDPHAEMQHKEAQLHALEQREKQLRAEMQYKVAQMHALQQPEEQLRAQGARLQGLEQ